MDMMSTVKLLKPDAMVGHWEFTFGKDRLNELLSKMGYPFLGGNVFDTDWEEPVFKSTAFFETTTLAKEVSLFFSRELKSVKSSIPILFTRSVSV